MVPYSAQFMKRFGIQAMFGIFERCLSHCFTAFINCNTKFSKGMSDIVKDFNYSRKLCDFVNKVLQISCLFDQREYKCKTRLR